MSTTVMPIIRDARIPGPVGALVFDDVPAGTTAHALCAIAAAPLAWGPLTGAQQQALLTDLHALLATAHVTGVAGAQGTLTLL